MSELPKKNFAEMAPELRVQLGLGSAALKDVGEANGVPSLDENGLIPWEQIPGGATGPVSTDALTEGVNNLYFTAARVRNALLTGLSTTTDTFINAGDSVLSAFGKLARRLENHKDSVDNPHGVTKAQVGLGNVSNLAPADMPVSTAQEAAITLKADLSYVNSALETRIPFFAAGVPLPAENIGPIWHADYASVMTWDGVGYASVGVGESRMFAFNAVPAGFLEENGATVSRTVYAGLFRRIGTTWGAGDGSTFKLPDSRGEFMRGFDNGRGIDSGRVFGSWQADQVKTHRHQIITRVGVDDSNFSWNQGVSSDMYTEGPAFYTEYTGGSENLVRNATRKFCIKF